jgi:hypothetical protein
MVISKTVDAAADEIARILKLQDILDNYRAKWDLQVKGIIELSLPNARQKKIMKMIDYIEFMADERDSAEAKKYCENIVSHSIPEITLTGLIASYFYIHDIFAGVTKEDLSVIIYVAGLTAYARGTD